MRFSTWHALGNVYLVAEPGDEPLTPDAVRTACGEADGVVEVLGVDQAGADVRIWNRDGSTAEMSGNGTRIAARWLAERVGRDEVEIRVGPRVVLARMLGGALVESDMGKVELAAPEKIAGLEVTAVRVGNPHAVVIGDPHDLPLIGPLLETHPRFPERTNVEVARICGPGAVEARIWERGVGETTASGSGAVAVAAATHPAGEVAVHFPGGDVRVTLADGRATLVGPAERVG